MKVLVLYENSDEAIVAIKLAANIEAIGSLLANAEVETTSYSGRQLRVCRGPQWKVEATAAPFESLPKPKVKRPPPPRGKRELIFDEEDD